jgi:imidazolonepropionase-like amidohydrolase
MVLRDANVLDEAGGFSGPLDVVVEDGVITAVEGDARAPEDAVECDFGELWLMPGMVDCHLHVSFSFLELERLLRMSVTEWAFAAARNLRATLEGGVTLVRDAGGADAGMRTAIERGDVPGPQLQVSVVALSQTGGHIDGFLPGPALEISADYVIPDWPGRPPVVVDGADEMRKAVRQVLRAGGDWIKLCTTGGVLSAHDDGDVAEFTLEEIQVAVFESARKGKAVMSHAFGGEGIDNAVKAGVRSIEHGIFLTEEQAAEMALADCWLVPTLAISRDIIAWAKAGLVPDYAVRKALALEPRIGDAVHVAREAGVKIALGTDYVTREQHGRNLEEILLVHQAGLTVAESLLAATQGGAELLGVGDRYGRIASGFVFDAIVLDEDPSDLAVFGRPGAAKGVFKDGELVAEQTTLRERTHTLGAKAGVA